MKLHEYQERGKRLLLHPGGSALNLDPGLGKTAVAISAFAEIGGKMLVIVPLQPMYGTWPDEIQKWAPHLTYSIVHGTARKREKALQRDVDVYLINPEGIAWLYREDTLTLHPEIDVLCIDESTKFKKSNTRRFRAVKKHLKYYPYRWIMTGTIAPNGLEDLYGQYFVLDQGKRLGHTLTAYRQKYFMQTGYRGYKWAPRIGAQAAITEKVAPITLQLKAEDYIDMPKFMKVSREVTLPMTSMDLYKKFERDFILELGEQTILAVNAAVSGQKCRQVSNGAVYDVDGEVAHVHDAKLEALQSIMEETNGHPLLIMYEFRHDRDRIMSYLGGDAVCLTGITGEVLQEYVDKFNKGDIRYLVMHPGSTHGMNIQNSCHHIVWFSIIWNLEHYIQANTRLYRQGQKSEVVMCYHLVAKNTVDVTVARALRRKELDQSTIEQALRYHCDVTEPV